MKYFSYLGVQSSDPCLREHAVYYQITVASGVMLKTECCLLSGAYFKSSGIL